MREAGKGTGLQTQDGGVASRRFSSPWWAGGLVAGPGGPSPGEQADDFGQGQGEGGGYSV